MPLPRMNIAGPSMAGPFQGSPSAGPTLVDGLGGAYLYQRGPQEDKSIIDEFSKGTPRPMQPGRAASFDGTNDYIQGDDASLRAALDKDQPHTISLWAKCDTPGGAAQSMFASSQGSGTNGVGIGVTVNILSVYRYNWAASATVGLFRVDFTSTNWVHILTTWDGSTARLFIDGIEKTDKGSGTAVGLTSGTKTNIGSNSSGSGVFFDGKIWDVRVYNRVLTAAEIAAIYADPTHNLYAANLIAHWPLEESVSSSPAYETVNQKHGTKLNGVAIYSGADVPGSFANDSGCTIDGTVGVIPISQSDGTLDAVGDAVEYSGRAPRNALVTASNCLSFDGVDDYVSLGTHAELNASQMTICCRVRLSNISKFQTLVSNTRDSSGPYKGWQFHVQSDNKIRFTLWNDVNGIAISSSTVAANQWYTLVGTYDGTNIRLYIDGILNATVAYAAGIGSPASYGLYIGRMGYSSVWLLDGKVDDVIYWNRALSDSEVASLSAGTIASSVVSRWKLSEGAGTVAHDSSGNGRHGTLTNGPTWTTDTVRPDNLLDGFSLYGHATLADIRVPYDSSGDPLVITPQSGYSLTSEHPAGPWHNAAESHIDFTGGVAFPGAAAFPNDYEFGDTLPGAWSKRASSTTENRFIYVE